ncbi:hypothetical protein CAEBREN_14609 [Caenorhabditis brenneri]|uniref:Peptidase S1 domain-containing protein n=1 Tax=Caenorhabditis brenneri TaxID=135651 RepID=G0P0A5_CAEBE|nr:hypothetical protein CAEBREN_14609 [Caenorhabditis brenneri]
MCFFDDYRHDDLAILELREDIPYSVFAQPICIAKNMDLQKLKTWVQATGFGLNYRYSIDNSTIQHPVLRHANMQIFHLPPNVHFFGTENRDEEIGLREGDSGGPGYIEGADLKNVLLGVASTGGGFKAYFASVGKHAKEICHHTGIC